MRPEDDDERISPMRPGLATGHGKHADAIRVLEALVRGLRAVELERRAEQAPLGLDALDETDLHGLLARGARHAGWGCFREIFYPTVAEELSTQEATIATKTTPARHRLPRDSERLRADLVLTPSPDLSPLDPLLSHRAARAAEGTLFAEQARRDLTGGAPGPPGTCPPRDAMWIEVKCTGQVAYADGVPRPNPRYGHELVSGPAGDLAKLAADPLFVHAAALLVAFVRDEPTARHDLGVLAHRLLDRNLDIAPPLIGGFAIADRVGNGWCALALVPLRLASRLPV